MVLIMDAQNCPHRMSVSRRHWNSVVVKTNNSYDINMKHGGHRKGAGRKPLAPAIVVKRLKLPAEIAAAQEQAATASGVSWSQWIRDLADHAMMATKSS